MADTAVCLATRCEAEEAIRELRLGRGLAILRTKDVKDGSEEVEFEIKTAQDQSTVWMRHLVQL